MHSNRPQYTIEHFICIPHPGGPKGKPSSFHTGGSEFESYRIVNFSCGTIYCPWKRQKLPPTSAAPASR